MTAPYMHDGRFATLGAVLDHYERLAADPAANSSVDERLRRAPLTTEERAELESFLLALADLR
jgi:cytochrome c peroxidase